MIAVGNSEQWETEQKKYMHWKTSKKGNWKEFENGEKKKPNWIIWVPCGEDSAPCEIARGWEGPDEFFFAMKLCEKGLVYKCGEERSFNEAEDDQFNKINKNNVEGYAKLGKNLNKEGVGWPCVGMINYRMQGKNNRKILSIRVLNDAKSTFGGAPPYRHKGIKMSMPGVVSEMKKWQGIVVVTECGPADLTTDLLDQIYDKNDRQ